MRLAVALCCLSLIPDAIAGETSAVPTTNAAATSQAINQYTSAGDSAFWVTAVIVVGFLLLAFGIVKKALAKHGGTWRLDEALSEEEELPAGTKSAEPKLIASSSRLIAFTGSLVLVGMFIGFGLYLLWAGFGQHGINAQWAASFSDYFKWGALMFLPYGANQLKNAISK